MANARQPSFLVIALCLPFILWGVCGILPTFDDYTTLQSPWWVQISDPGYFFPDAVRRPFDFLLGCIVGWLPSLFPALNHVLIILAHTISACLVFTICQRLRFSQLASNVATLFFFFSPATLGATLACDGFNQSYAQMWGLMALWQYQKSNRKHYWLVCVVLAALSKENGLAWAVVPPIVAYAFRQIPRQQALRHIIYGVLLALAYFGVYALIYASGIVHVEYPEEYSSGTIMSHVSDFIQLMAYTWLPMDYMSVVYPPTRSITIAVVTALVSLPFLLLLASRFALFKTRQALLLAACFIILAAPHLITVVSIMHNYAALAMASFIIAFFVSHINRCRSVLITFSLFMASALFTDLHHFFAARQSGLLGKELAMQAINHASQPLQRALVINIDNPDEPSYSSFCVRPVDAFGWGLSVRHYSRYEWNTRIDEVTLSHYDEQQVEAIADSSLRAGNEVVWVVGHRSDSLTIISEE